MSIYIVFDLDETIDTLHNLVLYGKVKYLYENKLSQEHFNCVLDLYPIFLRPSILTIFRYLKQIKQKNNNLKYLFIQIISQILV